MEAWLIRIADYVLAQSWQIAILTIVVALVTFGLRNRSAHVRYLLWLIVLAKALVPPLYSIPVAVLPQQELPAYVSSAPIAESVFEDDGMGQTASSSAVSMKPARYNTRAWLALGWLAGVVVLSSYYLANALRTQIWLQKRRRVLPSESSRDIEKFFTAHGVRRMPRVWLLERINQPFVWGLVRGSIYLPATLLDSRRAKFQPSLLAHELSHVIRFDAMVNSLQVVAQIIFWFHPFVWWANAKIRAEREKCCDEMTVARLNTAPEEYSQAIVETLAARYEQARPVPSLAVAGQVKNIEERIKTMLRPGKRFYTHPGPIVLLGVVLVALLAVPTALVLTARGQTRSAEPAAPTAPQADATLQNWDKPDADPWGWQPRYAARTFNSPMAFRVWVMVNYSGTRVVGNTPSATPLEIPPCWCWGVYTRSPVKDWDLLAREISLNQIPGLSLDSCTDSDFKHLAGLRDLRILHLPETAITDAGLESLEGLAELEDLGLENTPVTDAGLAHLKGLTNLRVLYLAKTRITDAGLQSLEGLTDLWGLVLDATQITDAGLQHLAGLTKLGWLRLNGTRVTDAGLEHLKGLTALRALQLGDTQVTARGFAHLKALPRLEDVSLNSRTITDDADLAKLVDSLPRLTWLNLGGSQITDAGLAHIRSLTGLHHLVLGRTKITDAGLAGIGSLTELQYLRLGETRITDAGLERLKGLPKLWALGLEGTQITDAGLEHLQGLKGLRKLYLNDTRVGDAGLEHLQGLTELTALYVPGTQITDAGLEHLKGLTKLGELSLVRTRITDSGLKYLQGLTELRGLGLIETQVTDAGVRQLQQALPNLTITRGPAQSTTENVGQPARSSYAAAADSEKPEPPRYAALTFNSKMAFDVWAQDTSSILTRKQIGRTPSETPLEIPACWLWGVQPSGPADDWDLLIPEVNQKEIPALALGPMGTDSALKQVAGLAKLRSLDVIRNSNVTDAGLAYIKGMSSLQTLTLSGTQLTDAGLEHLKGLTGLVDLYFAQPAFATDAGLKHLKDLTGLQRLWLLRAQITDAGLEYLKGMTRMEDLMLRETKITNAGIVHLKDMTKLKSLNLTDTQITDAALQYLKGMTELEALHLDQTPITDAGLEHLKGLTSLKKLYLNNTKVTDAGLEQIKGLTGLQELVLFGNQITDTGLKHLDGMTNMRTLGLSGNTQITGKGLEYLKGMTRLQWLGLADTGVTDASLENLKTLSGLQVLALKGTQVTDAGVQQLQQSLPDLTILR